MIKKSLTFAFAALFSTVVLADFSGKMITVDYVASTAPADPLVVPALNTTTVAAPGTITFTNFDGFGSSCDINVTATQIVIGTCNFGPFGNGGGAITDNGFRFTQPAPPDITGVTPTGPVTGVASNASSIFVNLINQDLSAATATLDVTFAAAPPPPVRNQTQAIPVLTPVGLGLLSILMAGASYVARRRR